MLATSLCTKQRSAIMTLVLVDKKPRAYASCDCEGTKFIFGQEKSRYKKVWEHSELSDISRYTKSKKPNSKEALHFYLQK